MVTLHKSRSTNPPSVTSTDTPSAVADQDLDARSDHVVVLDALGMIVMVNDAWRQFSQAWSPLPGLMAPYTDIGANYLEAAARGFQQTDGGDKAISAVSGILAVLSGQLDAFCLGYPCHTPSEQRWFRMMVTPVTWEGQRAVQIAHADATPGHRLQAGQSPPLEARA